MEAAVVRREAAMRKEDVMELLVAKRKARGLRQVDLATMTGVGQQEVSRWESGRFLTLEGLCRYANALGYDVELDLRERPQQDEQMFGMCYNGTTVGSRRPS